MRAKICLVLVGLLMVMAVPSLAETEETTGEDPAQTTSEEFVVKKLPYGVTVILEPDRPIRRAWTKNFTFDVDYNWVDESSYATTGLWFGNGITSLWFTYSRDIHIEDPGRASFSFSWTW